MTHNEHRTEFTAIRRALGWSQPATAEALGRSTSWVRRVEQGQIPCPKYAVYAMRWLQLHPDHASTSAP